MSRQRQLNALLFELQSARRPLERARILARAWRSVRDLSANDRRLLARYAAFDGAEELLENLARRSGGTAPALLLRALSSVEEDDGGSVARLVASLRKGAPFSELAVEAVDAAAGLVVEQVPQEEAVATPPPATGVREGDAGEAAAVTAAMAALSEVGRQVPEVAAGPAGRERSGRPEARAPKSVAETPEPTAARQEVSAVQPGAEERAPAVPRAVLMSEWDSVGGTAAPEVAAAGSSRQAADQNDRAPAFGLREEAESVLERFGKLHSQLQRRSSTSELHDLVLSFPDGWQRRRAVSRLLESEALRSLAEGRELVATLERELDRRWCLGLLLERHPVSSADLTELLENVSSPSARRRLSAMARLG